LTAETLKKKKHYNSFSPRVGFFLSLADVRAWFEEEEEEEEEKSSDGDGDQRLVRVVR
jgi:aprataxin